eukprot:2593645-Amphidinium_carterae.1
MPKPEQQRNPEHFSTPSIYRSSHKYIGAHNLHPQRFCLRASRETLGMLSLSCRGWWGECSVWKGERVQLRLTVCDGHTVVALRLQSLNVCKTLGPYHLPLWLAPQYADAQFGACSLCKG